MFKDAYKNALNSVSPREGIIEEIIAKHSDLEKTKKKSNVKTPVFKRVSVYAASIAALFVISTAFIAYPVMLKNHKERSDIAISTAPPITNGFSQSDYDKTEIEANAKNKGANKTEGENRISNGNPNEKIADEAPNVAPSENYEIADSVSESSSVLTDSSEVSIASDKAAENVENVHNSADSVSPDTGRKSLPKSEQAYENEANDSSDGGRLFLDAPPANESAKASSGGGGGSSSAIKAFDYSAIEKSGKSVINSGFKNVTPINCTSRQTAVMLAKNELLSDLELGGVYFDYEQNVWMVTFLETSTNTILQRVFLNTDGITLLITLMK